MEYLERGETRLLVGLSKGFMAIGCSFVFHEKDASRICSEGEIDYEELFYQVVKHTSAQHGVDNC